jgi:hypothetical protein
MRISVHRQRDCRMPGPNLRFLGVNASGGQVRNELMTERVKIENPAVSIYLPVPGVARGEQGFPARRTCQQDHLPIEVHKRIP